MDDNFVKSLFIVATVVTGFVNFGLMTYYVRHGHVRGSVLVVLVASPVAIIATWLLVQRATPGLGTFTFGNISYAATVGDLFILTTVVGLTANQWFRHVAAIPEFFKSGAWLAISFCLGLLYGVVTHFVIGGKPDSNSLIRSEQLHDSATSWVHNLGVTPAIAGAVLCTVVPLFFVPGGRLAATGITVILVFGWGGLVVLDMWRSQLDSSHPLHFNPQWLDVVMDWAHLRPRT